MKEPTSVVIYTRAGTRPCWARGDLDAAYPVGESLRDVLTRMRAALSRAAARAEDGPAVLVGHGGSLGLFAGQLLAPHERRAFVRLANASVSEVLLTSRGGEFSVRVVTWNGTQHLDAVGIHGRPVSG